MDWRHRALAIDSAARRRYRPTAPSADPDLDTVVNYFWNMALADALYCSLCAVEIALRNTIHTSLSRHFGASNWYDQTAILERHQQDELAGAKQRIARRQQSLTADRVVGELTFGFWVTLLSRTYDARFWRATHAATLRTAFPNVQKSRRQRGTIHQRYNEIRELRNRVSHHEPLFDDSRLKRRHEDVLWGIHWINPELRRVIERFDRFPDVHQNGRARLEAEIRSHVGLSP